MDTEGKEEKSEMGMGIMTTTLCTHNGKQWVQVGVLADIMGDPDTGELDFTLRGIGAHPAGDLSTTNPRVYRVRHKFVNPQQDIFYEFDAVVAAIDGDTLTLKLTSEPTEPERWRE